MSFITFSIIMLRLSIKEQITENNVIVFPNIPLPEDKYSKINTFSANYLINNPYRYFIKFDNKKNHKIGINVYNNIMNEYITKY